MRIVSWNVHRCIGTDGAYRPERIAECLAELDADLIALQEIDSSLKTDSGRDQLTYLASYLEMDAMMGPTLERDYGAYGNALLSRHRLLTCEEHDLSYRKFEPRGALATHLQVQVGQRQQLIRIVATHLGLKYWERSFQIDRLLSELVWADPPITILLGDFNEWFPWTGNNLRLERSFAPSPRLKTFPAPWPRFSLDRIYVSGVATPIEYSVPRNELTRVASDHLPIIANLQLSLNS